MLSKKQQRIQRDKIIAVETLLTKLSTEQQRPLQNSPQNNCSLLIPRNQKRFAAGHKTRHSCNAAHLKNALTG